MPHRPFQPKDNNTTSKKIGLNETRHFLPISCKTGSNIKTDKHISHWHAEFMLE